jgi:hypothetical protein
MRKKPLAWWGWLAIVGLLSAGLLGLGPALVVAIGLSAVQTAHCAIRIGSPMAFPVQVRAGYLALLVVGCWPPLSALHWIQAVGGWTMLLADYCLLARCLSLAPWNRRSPLSGALLVATFLSPPTPGCFLDRRPA